MQIPKNLRWEDTGNTLGEGGQAQVRLVKDKTEVLSGLWALKALKSNQRGQAYKRFIREVAAIKELDHPNIIQIVDNSNPTDDFQYYVMENIDGSQTLEKVITSENNPYYGNTLKALDLFEQLCEAINAWQSCNPSIVHRDLSPVNVILSPTLAVKIIDFGLCQKEDQQGLTQLDEGVGTPNYMAPECESGSDEKITIYADLYSAGKILWSAITGMQAFARESSVFNNKSMPVMFPTTAETWHLHHIFENTIRHDPSKRWALIERAIKMSRRLRYLITNGYPPLELLGYTCPICGFGKLSEDFEGDHIVFGSQHQRGIFYSQCSYCGYCIPINYHLQRNTLKERKELD